jgi:uncharacterized repeat protein (TIGR01451 family)
MEKVMKRIAAIFIGITLLSVLVTPVMAVDLWVSDSDIASGLAIPGLRSAPTVFNMDGTWYLLSGNSWGEFHGFYWNLKRSKWLSDSGIVSGLPHLGEQNTVPEVFCMDETWYLIAYHYPEFYGFNWTGSTWQSDPAIVSGLAQVNTGGVGYSTVFNKDGTWYLIVNEYFGNFVWRPTGYNWTGSEWQSDPAIVSGLEGSGYLASAVFNKDETWYLIGGKSDGTFSGFARTGLTWESDPVIVSGLSDLGQSATPEVFYKDGTWYLLSGEDNGIFHGFHYHYPTKPDLVSTIINVPELFVNQPSTITATIANVGVLDASSFNVSLSANGAIVDTANVPSLGVGNSTNVSFAWTPASGGDQELCVVADADNEIDEIDEVNNKKSILVTVNAPDLTPTAINVPPLFVNQPSTITATIANVGALDAASFNVSLSADGSVVGTARVASLSAGRSTDVSFAWTPAAGGDIELCIAADPDDEIVEMNETNNRMCIGVEIKPDLTPTGITTPELLLLNKSGVINATIANIGGADAGSFNVSLSANSAVVDTASVASLGAGNSTNVSFAWTPASAGYHELCIAADSDGSIAELNETNNENCIAVTVRSPSIDVDKTVWDTGTWEQEVTAKVGDTLRFRCSVNNSGSLNLTTITVSDVLSDSLEYRDSATVDGVPQEPVQVGPHEYEWFFTRLEPCQNVTIEFDARVVTTGTDTNVLNARAWCEETEEWVSDVDSVRVTVPTSGGQHDAVIPWDAERLIGGNTLIAEFGNHTVIEVTPAGAIEWQYGNGTAGSGPGQLDSPADAERLSDGSTLIADRNNHRVIEVDSTGAIVWAMTGLNYPMDAERLSDGSTLIADRLNNRVIDVTPAGDIAWQMTGLNHPFDADRLDNGNTLIVEYKNHRVIEITPAGEIVWQYGTGTPGSGVNELNYPTDAERLPDGSTLIVDSMNDRVIMVRTSDYDPAKGYNGFTADSIVWAYESNYPTDAERLSNNYTLISEAGNNRVIEVFTPAPKPKELKPRTSFLVSGFVSDVFGPVNNPTVIVTNLNTSEVFTAETIEDSSYYQVLTSSEHVCCVGNALHFNVSDNGNKNITIHVVTEEDITAGGFEQNITVTVPYTDLIVTAINAYHNNTDCPAWFNLSNEIDVTVKNAGTAPANESTVSLYIEDVFFGKLPVPGLNSEESATVTFSNWMPVGGDCLQSPCEFEWSYRDYTLTGIADGDNDVNEPDETNNATAIVETVYYNGYMADEPLENVAHGMLHGGLLFTTGDGVYSSLYSVGDTQVTNYDITLERAAVKLAHLNVYYTWNKPTGTCPEMEVNITTPGGTTHTLLLMRAYNDIKCTSPDASWVLPFGNYVYNVTDYITESGTYTVTVKNNCTACDYFCPAAPGLLILYADENAPQIEYWLNEGADVLMGGRRYPTSSNLAWWENINNATFPASDNTSTVRSAALGVVAPWGGSTWEPGSTNYLFFNSVKLGNGVYHDEPYEETIDGITMHIGSTNAQVGVNVTDVTALYLNGSDNVVGQADDGDNMMPAGAFLVVAYGPPPTNEPPIADAGPDQTALVNETVTFNGSGSYDPDGTIVSYEWYFGDGNVTTTTEAIITHAYATAGTYTVTLTVTDNEGATGTDAASVKIAEEGIEAGVRIEPETLNLGSQGQFTAYISLSEPYEVENISISTVACEGAEVVDWNFASADGGTLVAKFDRQGLREDLPAGDAVLMSVTGELQSGEAFAGYDSVTVIPDTEAPYTAGHEPAPNPEKKYPIDTNITAHVRDDGFGVDMSTIVMTVNDTAVSPVITGDNYDYTLVYDPPVDFGYGQAVNVTIDATDLARPRNVMATDAYSFITET